MRSRSASALAIAAISPFAFHAQLASAQNSGTVPVTPHDAYSSSVGVLGCMIDTNRVAYWPDSIDCTNICVSLTYQGRQVYLLRIDQSAGAHDVSYDAWNYLYTGESATQNPTAGGAIDMQFENVEAFYCEDLIHTSGNKLPLSAANSMNFVASCLAQPSSWVAQNYVLYNILDPICTLGYDETCTLDWPAENQPTCSNMLGDPVPLSGEPVYNIEYPSGQVVLASDGVPAPPANGTVVDDTSGSGGGHGRKAKATVATWTAIFAAVFSVGVTNTAALRNWEPEQS